LCNILIEFGVLMELVRLIKMCLNETCTGKYLSDNFPSENSLKERNVTILIMLTSIQFRHYCLPVCSLKMQKLECTRL
jgi:hypothetical protein